MANVKKSTETVDPEKIKQKIIRLFNKNVKGKTPDSSASNIRHDGKDGHWLEVQMGVAHNASNSPDLYGFEMKILLLVKRLLETGQQVTIYSKMKNMGLIVINFLLFLVHPISQRKIDTHGLENQLLK